MPEIFAHRGLHVLERENTLAAFRAAKELGIDGVELDVRRSADGVLVIHHDPSIDGDVIAHSASTTLPSYVPTLREALEELEGVKVNVEIKNIQDPREPTYDESGDFARAVLAELDEGPWDRAGIISSFDLATLEDLRAADPKVRLGWLLWTQDVDEAAKLAHEREFDALHPHFSRVDAGTVRRARERHLEVNVWTVNQPADITSMVEIGVNCIMSDDPATAMQLAL